MTDHKRYFLLICFRYISGGDHRGVTWCRGWRMFVDHSLFIEEQVSRVTFRVNNTRSYTTCCAQNW